MNLETPLLSDAVSHHVLGDDIQSIHVRDFSRRSIATLTALLQLLYADTEDDSALYLLIDCGHASAFNMTQLWDVLHSLRHTSKHPPVVVALLQAHPMKALDAVLKPLRSKVESRLFQSQERDRAIGWLLSKQLDAQGKAAAELIETMNVI